MPVQHMKVFRFQARQRKPSIQSTSPPYLKLMAEAKAEYDAVIARDTQRLSFGGHRVNSKVKNNPPAQVEKRRYVRRKAG